MLYMFQTLFASIIRSTINCLTAATGVCHEWGWSKSCIDVQGRLSTVLFLMAKLGLQSQFGHEIVQCSTDLDIYTGFIPAQLMTDTSGCCYSL